MRLDMLVSDACLYRGLVALAPMPEFEADERVSLLPF